MPVKACTLGPEGLHTPLAFKLACSASCVSQMPVIFLAFGWQNFKVSYSSCYMYGFSASVLNKKHAAEAPDAYAHKEEES